MKLLHSQRGFTLIELMITLAIIAILAAIAIPSYQNYVHKSYFIEIVSATAPYRVAVGECVQTTSTLNGCNAGTNHIPGPITTATGHVASLSVANGVITVTPVASNGIQPTDTYVMTPTLAANGVITWASSGGAVMNGYAQ